MTWEGRGEVRDLERLAQLDVFAKADECALKDLARVATWHRYERRERIEGQRDDRDLEHVVVSGQIQISLVSIDGRQISPLHLSSGDFFDLLSRQTDGHDEVVAEAAADETVICSLPWRDFLRVVSADTRIASKIIERQRVYHWQLEQLTGQLALHDVRTQVKHVLRRLARENVQHVVPFTLEDIARMAGTSVGRASRVVAELQRQGVVSCRRRGHIEIPDPDTLR